MLGRAARLVVLLAVLMLTAFSVAPAFAHHKDGHERGGKDGEESEVTEANDGDSDDATDPNEDDDDNAHPSGKDRSVEGGGSGNQGNSSSDPDDDGRGPDRSNGGPDKPGGSGGVDAADQDGNNGCGNDDDFEDDNEGWCGGKPKPQPTESPEVLPSGGNEDDDDVDDDVLGSSTVKPDVRVDQAAPGVLGTRVVAAPATAVRAARQVAAAAEAALPFTGSGVVLSALAGLGLLGAGWALVRRHA